MRREAVLGGLVAALLVGACARTPLRTVATLDTSVPAGRSEDQRFTGEILDTFRYVERTG